MAATTAQQQKLRRLKNKASTTSPAEFALMCKHYERPNIVAEGDSWFDYPKKYVVAGRSANVVDHIEKWTKGKANLLRLASNGDEAMSLVAKKQRHRLCSVLDKARRRGTPVDVLLFSGGGNDIVGDWDMPRYLKTYKPGYSAAKCVNAVQLKAKMNQIAMAHVELMSVRNYYSPDTVIVTHTYDRVIPSDKGAKFVGMKLSRSWLKPHMDDKGIPDTLQDDVANILMERLATLLKGLMARPEAKGKYIVVDTMGTLGKREWLNEIHPTSAGFKKIAKKIYREASRVVDGLPPALT